MERSTLCKRLSEMKDNIMSDRGIMVQDLLATSFVFVNYPTMLAGKSQYESDVVVKDRRIA